MRSTIDHSALAAPAFGFESPDFFEESEDLESVPFESPEPDESLDSLAPSAPAPFFLP